MSEPTSKNRSNVSRRRLIASAAATSISAALPGAGYAREQAERISRKIPSSGETIPGVGMGTWITFNVGASKILRRKRLDVLRAFFDHGGGMIDSSPMYGSSQDVVGWCLERLDDTPGLFSATKVWTTHTAKARDQMAQARDLWRLGGFDLMQVHNLVNWEHHLETLREEKAAGRIRYIGVTTSHGSRHAEIERVMRDQAIDFVQFTYNVLDREAEARLLPLARERGLAVIINRPFRRGNLFNLFEHRPLPDWTAEFDCRNWAQFFLKFILSHPAVTCAIPATSQVAHMHENMGAMQGRLPDKGLRQRMVRYAEGL